MLAYGFKGCYHVIKVPEPYAEMLGLSNPEA
jgi:hypothetical protein